MKSDKPRVLFITPLPPPVHGSAMVSQYIKDSKLVQGAFDCDFVNLSTSRRMDEIGKGGVRKLLRFVGAYFAVLGKLLTHRYALCYLAITCHDMGFLKDAPFVLLCKLFRRKVLIHQHNKGMSGCVDKWPYKWLLPLVYRNTTVMLLSWYLYEDISRVVSREQVVVCANGVPPLDNGQQSTDNGLLRDEGFGLTQTLHDAAPIPSGVIACSDHELHGLHEYSGASATKIISHGCSRIDTDSQNLLTSPLASYSFGELKLSSSQPTLSHRVGASLACGHPEGDSRRLNENDNEDEDENDNVDDAKQNYLTQTSQIDTDISCNAVEPSAPRLLFLSNLIESKGVYVLLDACKVLKERGMSFVCDYVGGESKMISAEAFREAIAERGLAECVAYHGPQYGEDKHRFFMNADVFVQPTFDDCFPLTLVEAMQYRLPIVSTDVGAIPDMVKDGENGFICKQRDVSSLVVALETLIRDGELRTQMGEQGYAFYRRTMTLEVFEKRFETLLREVSQH